MIKFKYGVSDQEKNEEITGFDLQIQVVERKEKIEKRIENKEN
jgi:hypothetical protein